MNSMQPFGYTGAPGTCKWCGRKIQKSRRIARGGDHFDVESCAVQFGAASADIGVVFARDGNREGVIVGGIRKEAKGA